MAVADMTLLIPEQRKTGSVGVRLAPGGGGGGGKRLFKVTRKESEHCDYRFILPSTHFSFKFEDFY